MGQHTAEIKKSKDNVLATKRVVQDEVDDDFQDDESNNVEEVEEVEEYEEEEQEDDGGAEEYEVEKVVGHKRENKVLSFMLKWKGYADEESTWETNDNLHCAELIRAYWERYEGKGGKKTDVLGRDPSTPLGFRSVPVPTFVAKKPNTVRGPSAVARRAAAARAEAEAKTAEAPTAKATISSVKKVGRSVDQSAEPAAKKQKVVAATTLSKQTNGKKPSDNYDNGMDGEDEILAEGDGEDGEDGSDWKPPRSWSSWEDEVSHVQTVERSKHEMLVYLSWKNGQETEHPITDAHEKCPQKLIKFYESHLRFAQQPSA